MSILFKLYSLYIVGGKRELIDTTTCSMLVKDLANNLETAHGAPKNFGGGAMA